MSSKPNIKGTESNTSNTKHSDCVFLCERVRVQAWAHIPDLQRTPASHKRTWCRLAAQQQLSDVGQLSAECSIYNCVRLAVVAACECRPLHIVVKDVARVLVQTQP